ncbi:MAG: hypothetical protein ACUVQ8_05475 [Nitrososphaeria archaeon]
MNKINKSLATNVRIYFDTVDSKAIYYILDILRNKRFHFTILDEGSQKDADIIFTDKKKCEGNVLRINELTYTSTSDFERIASKLFRTTKESLLVGVDPGKRMGIAAYFGNRLIVNDVIFPWEDAVLFIVEILKMGFNRKVLKIGQGDRKTAEELKKVVQSRFNDIEIYLVDERRTTKTAKKKGNQGKEKDKISAVEIAHKNGKRVV